MQRRNNMTKYEQYLKQSNLSNSTIKNYVRTINQFKREYSNITKENLLCFKSELIDRFKPITVNTKLQGINKYLSYIKKDELKLKFIKIQQKNFLENVISDSDYRFFKNKLKRDGKMNWYFVVRYLAATGARIAELTQIKVEHVQTGYIDIYGKGGKVRRVYIPHTLCEETLQWLDSIGQHSGYLFLNKQGNKITCRGIEYQLKTLGASYGLDPKVIYPHSFRHRFAKNFLDKYNDIALLADLMGHDSIETTRIYLRKSSTEQQQIVNRIVTW